MTQINQNRSYCSTHGHFTGAMCPSCGSHARMVERPFLPSLPTESPLDEAIRIVLSSSPVRHQNLSRDDVWAVIRGLLENGWTLNRTGQLSGG